MPATQPDPGRWLSDSSNITRALDHPRPTCSWSMVGGLPTRREYPVSERNQTCRVRRKPHAFDVCCFRSRRGRRSSVRLFCPQTEGQIVAARGPTRILSTAAARWCCRPVPACRALKKRTLQDFAARSLTLDPQSGTGRSRTRWTKIDSLTL